MNEVTEVLLQIDGGDSQAAAQLLPIVYQELRKLASQRLAQEKPGQTLQATALVHEAFLRLVDVKEVPKWNSRGHFFGAAAEAMRRILVENARRKGRVKRGGSLQRHAAESIELAADEPVADVLAIDEAISKLAVEHPEKAALVKLRYFAGLTLAESAKAMNISTATAERQWRYARAWLARELA